jgi:hypothetical protein
VPWTGGMNRTARKNTAWLLARALSLAEPAEPLSVAAGCGRAPAAGVPAARHDTASAASSAAAGTLSRDIASFTGHRPGLAQLIDAVTGSAGTGDGVVDLRDRQEYRYEPPRAPPPPARTDSHHRT